MSFDWMSTPTPRNRNQWAEKRIAALRREVQQQASLLMGLGHSPDYAIGRCRQNLLWDHELTGPPEILDEVEALVRGVAKRTLSLNPRS